MTIAFYIALAALAVACIACGVLYAKYRQLRVTLTETDASRQQLRDTFNALAGEALQRNNEQFIQLAEQTLKTGQAQASQELETRKQAIEQLVKPLKETLDRYNTSVHEVEKSRKEAYGSLRQQLGSLIDDQRQLRQQTSDLIRALRRPEVRGQWGEIQLRRVAELAGMIPHCDFQEQVTLHTEDGVQRPDMVVNLPSNRTIIVDAKTPLDAYLSAIEAEDDDQRQTFLETHANQIMKKVTSLSGKQYVAQFERTPDFVVLFIPGEPFLYAAVQCRPTLIESAMEKGVVIATPSTLIALLKAVAAGWREERLAENARQISELGVELHKRLCDAVEHMMKVGKSLDRAVGDYNQMVGSIESRLMVSARRFEDLGANSTKSLPEEIAPVERAVREITPPQ